MDNEKRSVTLIQSKDGIVRRARIDGVEFPVMHAAPTMVEGKLSVAMTIVDVELSGERADDVNEGAGT